MARVSIPDVAPRFRAYLDANPTWGALHCVLEDGNVDDESVAMAAGFASNRGDAEGEALARILMTMSRTQRRRLPYYVTSGRV